jgi:hypothetical protein
LLEGPPIAYAFINVAEAEFVEAAVARLIPADGRWPGVLEAVATNYIDKQMAGVGRRREAASERPMASRHTCY